jgi:diamine N-acetyltransferase
MRDSYDLVPVPFAVMVDEVYAGRQVSLRKVTKDTVRTICALETTGFVAPNAVSIAQAYFEPHAWFRAIYADDEPVGFLMLYDDPHDPAGPRYYLWRLMIAAGHQRKGYGRRALQLLVDHVRGRPGATHLGTSCFPASGGGPERFYRSFGFEPTGEVIDDEVVLRLALGTVR